MPKHKASFEARRLPKPGIPKQLRTENCELRTENCELATTGFAPDKKKTLCCEIVKLYGGPHLLDLKAGSERLEKLEILVSQSRAPKTTADPKIRRSNAFS